MRHVKGQAESTRGVVPLENGEQKRRIPLSQPPVLEDGPQPYLEGSAAEQKQLSIHFNGGFSPQLVVHCRACHGHRIAGPAARVPAAISRQGLTNVGVVACADVIVAQWLRHILTYAGVALRDNAAHARKRKDANEAATTTPKPACVGCVRPCWRPACWRRHLPKKGEVAPHPQSQIWLVLLDHLEAFFQGDRHALFLFQEIAQRSCRHAAGAPPHAGCYTESRPDQQ